MFDDMIAYMEASPIVTEFFLRGKKDQQIME